MTNPTYAHLELLIDESGSMSDLKETVKSSVNGLITEQISQSFTSSRIGS